MNTMRILNHNVAAGVVATEQRQRQMLTTFGTYESFMLNDWQNEVQRFGTKSKE
jgi:hypothetical protein